MTQCSVRSAVASFFLARRLVADSFGTASASELVSAVLSGVHPRRGFCSNGWEYFVHGVGYTVVMPDGAQLHIDGSNSGDVLSLYDIRFYMESLDCVVPSIDEVRRDCDLLATAGNLMQVDEVRYALLVDLDHQI